MMTRGVRRPATAVGPLVVPLSVSLFFLWGLANNLNDILIQHFRTLFTLSDFESGLVQSAFYFGYFCFAVPAALVTRRFGYKNAVVVGLLLFGGGALLFGPAAARLSYPLFLFALFVIASGLAFLETSANPMMTVLGDPARAARRLNLAQAFNPLGSIVGIGVGATFILSATTPATMSPAAQASAAGAAQATYLVIAVVVLAWAAAVALTRFPAAATARAAIEEPMFTGFGALLGNRRFLGGVTAQFFYVGAQVGIWSFLIRYCQAEAPNMGVRMAAGLLTASLALFMAGRFAGTAAMTRIAPARLMLGFAVVDAALCLVAIVVGGTAGIAALVAASAFMSIMYPTIFALALRDLGPLTKPGASLIVMAIVGGAVLTAAMGLVSDIGGTIRLAMLVPMAAFVVVGWFAFGHRQVAA